MRKRKWTKPFISIGLVATLWLSTVSPVYAAAEAVIQIKSADEKADSAAEVNEEENQVDAELEAMTDGADTEVFGNKGEEGESSEEELTKENPVSNSETEEMEENSNTREEAKENAKTDSEQVLDEPVKMIEERVDCIGSKTQLEEEKTGSEEFVIKDGVLSKYNGDTDKVIIPSGVTSIGEYAFEFKTMSEVVIPNTVQSIGEGAFGGCEYLSKITIPSSVKSIGILAFSYCSSLKNVTLSNGLNKISRGAFRGCPIEKIKIPSTVSKVEAFAFQYCSKLKEVVAMEGVTALENGAFDGCYNLEKLIVPSSVNDLGYEWSFEDCPNVVIYGKLDSYAEKFAKKYNISFKLIAAPKAVENLKAISVGKQKVQLSWSKVTGAEGYLIYSQKNGKYGYCGMTTKGTSFTDVKALDSDYNYYWVFPYITDMTNDKMLPGGCLKYVYAKGVIPAVQNLKASSVKGGVKLTWTKQVDADGYLVYGQNGENSKYHYIGMTTKGTTFTDKKASKKDYNFYWVYPYHKNAAEKMIVGGTAPYTYGRAK